MEENIIIDYGMGNLGSIQNMFKKIGSKAVITSDPDLINDAKRLILPGVGAFGKGMQILKSMNLIDVLNQKVLDQKTPILGLCLGMQLFTNSSEEAKESGLGWIDAETIRFKFEGEQSNLKIPHMGWNYVEAKQTGSIFDTMYENPKFYFVHSYHVNCKDEKNVLAVSEYGYEFPAGIIKDNIIGLQFHPEKSHKYGMKLFSNFLEIYS